METILMGYIGFRVSPSNVIPFGVWYGFLVRTLMRSTKKGTTLAGLLLRNLN